MKCNVMGHTWVTEDAPLFAFPLNILRKNYIKKQNLGKKYEIKCSKVYSLLGHLPFTSIKKGSAVFQLFIFYLSIYFFIIIFIFFLCIYLFFCIFTIYFLVCCQINWYAFSFKHIYGCFHTGPSCYKSEGSRIGLRIAILARCEAEG